MRDAGTAPIGSVRPSTLLHRSFSPAVWAIAPVEPTMTVAIAQMAGIVQRKFLLDHCASENRDFKRLVF